MAKAVKVGFIGSGGIARTHMGHLSKIEGVELVAAADINKNALAQAQKEYGVKQTFTDWKELLELKELDAVSVCTPNNLHAGPTIAALNAGKHVLCEKPLAMNAKEGAQMVAAAKKAKKILQIAFQYRFSPSAQAIRKQVADGALGNILYTRCQALRRRGIPNWGVFGRKELQGGGPMIDIGVHILEMSHFVIGKPKPVAARGFTWTYLGNKKSETLCPWNNWDYKTYNVEDLAVGMITFEDGSTLVIEASFAAHIEKDVWNSQIMGTKGGATIDPPKIFTDQHGLMVNIEPSFVGKWDGFQYKMQHWIECIRDGKKCEAPGEDGLVIQKMLDGVYESSCTGKEVRIR